MLIKATHGDKDINFEFNSAVTTRIRSKSESVCYMQLKKISLSWILAPFVRRLNSIWS